MKKINKITNNIKNYHFIIVMVFIITISFITVGFALYDELLPISGNIIVKKYGVLEITNITLLSSSNVQSTAVPSFDKKNATFNIVFNGSEGIYQVVYQIEVTNKGSSNYIYSSFDYNPTITSENTTGVGSMSIDVSGIENGDVITPNEVKVFTVTMNLTVTDSTTTYFVAVDANVESTNDTQGRLAAAVSPNTGNLQAPNTLASFSIDIINTYTMVKTVNLVSSNSNFLVVDSSGNELSSINISPNTTQTYSFYLKKKNNAVFLSNTEKTTILLKSNDNTIQCGTLTVNVDIYVEPDTTIPTVGNVMITINNTIGSFTSSWSRIDTGGSNITNYTVLLYDSSNTLISTSNTDSDVTSYTHTDITAGTYYIIVYGTDEAGNTGSSYVTSATTNNGYAAKSNNTSLKWIFDVTNNVSNITYTGNTTANISTTYQATLKASSGYKLPNSITVTMGGNTLTSGTGYTYSSSTGAVSIPNVSGDIKITASGSIDICLVEGTKVLLANKTYKNIEDINYDDLLLVYNYETGTLTQEYPIWIENESVSDNYQLTKFSDGTYLKTAGFHGIFNFDLNRFVSVDNTKEFYVGATVAKINKNKTKLKKVKVVSIENIKEKVKHYHVVSTRYYNIFANDFLTTDGTVILSNLYGFDGDITWPKKRKNIVADASNLYEYNDLNVVPYYMFLGLRMEEAKILNNYGLDKDTFIYYLKYNQLNKVMLKEPIKQFGKRLWMVTTSDDDINILNKNSYLLKEGSYYTLKNPKTFKNFIGWYNTGNNKVYNIGDTVKIYYGTYFKALYKKS